MTREPLRKNSARALVAFAAVLVGVLFGLPLAVVWFEALAKGPGAYVASITSSDTLAALRSTLFVVALVVPFHLVLGFLVAYLVVRYPTRLHRSFRTLLDLPFAVSPIVAGLMFVLLFGPHGLLRDVESVLHIQVLYAMPGIVLATLFVTLPFVAREVMPLLSAQGNGEEEAARTLGASFWETLRRITLPNAKPALILGGILTAARAAGEFGAVSVVSGSIRGETTTLPLHVELLADEYQTQAAFASASLLVMLSLIALFVKARLETHPHAR